MRLPPPHAACGRVVRRCHAQEVAMFTARRWCALVALMCVVSACMGSRAAAGDTDVWSALQDLRARSAEQDAEIAHLRAALGGPEECCAVDRCCCDCCCVGPCCSCGWYADG